MEFSRQEYWSGLPCPSPEDLPNPGIKPRSPELQGDSLPAEPPSCYLAEFINSSKFCVESLGCSLHGMLFAYNDSFTFSLSVQIPFIFFFYGLISMARTSNTILNRSGESGHSCALDFRGKAINFSPSSIMLAVGLS